MEFASKKLYESLQRLINVAYVFKNGALGLFEKWNVANDYKTLQRFRQNKWS